MHFDVDDTYTAYSPTLPRSDLLLRHTFPQPFAWIFFLIYLMVGSFTMLNLFIAVVCSAMQEEITLPAQRTAAHDDLLLREVKALREEVRAMRQNA